MEDLPVQPEPRNLVELHPHRPDPGPLLLFNLVTSLSRIRA